MALYYVYFTNDSKHTIEQTTGERVCIQCNIIHAHTIRLSCACKQANEHIFPLFFRLCMCDIFVTLKHYLHMNDGIMLKQQQQQQHNWCLAFTIGFAQFNHAH